MVGFVGTGAGVVARERRTVVCVGGSRFRPSSGLGSKPTASPGSGSSTVLERPTKTQKAKVDPGKRYNVIVFGDGSQTREFISQVLQKCLPGMQEDQAKKVAERAKKVGKAVVGCWIFEMAEAYCDSLRSNGLSADIELE